MRTWEEKEEWSMKKGDNDEGKDEILCSWSEL
jgi:hypothetical protein